ncbi:MAG TPA: ABC transporter permease [Bryobacteraceae bacterium]|nr:ABC transporter permease [Bryobacteraceae bacterium]
MHSLWQDLRFGVRNLCNDHGFLVACVIALGLGIGSSTAIFSVIDNVLLHPFPYANADRIYGFRIVEANSKGADRNYFTVPEFLDYQRQNRIFTDTMGVWEATSLLGSGDRLEPLDTDTVTDNAFQFLGVPAMLGRGIVPGDGNPGAPPVFVLSYKVWLSKFGGDPNIIGQNFLLNDRPTTLVGIMPQRFAFWGGDIWTPTTADPAQPGAEKRNFVLYGHLKPGLAVSTAEADLTSLAKQLSAIYPRTYPKQFTVRMDSLGYIAVGRFRPALLTLLAAVGLLLLIACANVANLLLARATIRQKEIALRMTLGAGRWRVVRQLMIESVLLSFAGAVAGCLFAAAALKGLIALVPLYTFPDEAIISINREVLLVTVATAVLTAFIFGLAPALASTRGDLIEPLRGASRGNTGVGRSRMRQALIVGEITLSMLLLTGSGLLMRTFLLERQIDLGIRTGHVLITSLSLPPVRYGTTDAQAGFVRELLPRLEALPGVISAAAALNSPPYGGTATEFDVPGISHFEHWKGSFVPCSRQYFRTIGLRLLAGRVPTADDENAKRKVAVINQSAAKKYFGRQDPLGRLLVVSALKNAPDPVADPRFEVIGVVSDMKNQGLLEDVAPEAFIPYSVAGYGAEMIFLHTVGEPAALNRGLTAEILRLDRSVIPQQMMPLETVLDIGQYAQPRFGLGLFSVFAAIGLVLVTIGVYSVVSWTVTQQRQEIGIRMALGASAGDVRSMVLAGTLRLVLAGVAIGLALAQVVARVLASQLWGVSGYDPLTVCAVITILIVVALAAAYVPSLRATRVDPAACLRSE